MIAGHENFRPTQGTGGSLSLRNWLSFYRAEHKSGPEVVGSILLSQLIVTQRGLSPLLVWPIYLKFTHTLLLGRAEVRNKIERSNCVNMAINGYATIPKYFSCSYFSESFDSIDQRTNASQSSIMDTDSQHEAYSLDQFCNSLFLLTSQMKHRLCNYLQRMHFFGASNVIYWVAKQNASREMERN